MVEKVFVVPSQGLSLSTPVLDHTPPSEGNNYRVTEFTKCRVCGGEVVQIANFGSVCPVYFSAEQTDQPCNGVALALIRCVECDLVQLSKSVERDQLFRTYWYQSNLNSTMVAALADIAYNTKLRVPLYDNDTVVDIGCNDGTLLSFFPQQKKVGFDPALNLKPNYVGKFFNDYFRSGLYQGPPAKLITAIAMFYDLDDPLTFLVAVAGMLADEGIFVLQMTDLASMVITNAFDNVCHEHVTYWSLKALDNLCRQVGMMVFDVTYNNVNGGSIRAFIRKGSGFFPKVTTAIEQEAPYISPGAINGFVGRSNGYSTAVTRFIIDENKDGKTTDVLGASTKGNTFLRVARLGRRDIRWAAEVHPGKVGLNFGSSGIPIVSEKHSLNIPPSYYLVLPWHFLDFFRRKLSWHLCLDGGGLIVPLPEPVLITKHGVKRL